MYNARYVPPNGNRRPQPPPRPPAQKRVQIVDHNRQTPSSEYISERESQNSYSPDTKQRAPQARREHPPPDHKSESNHGSAQRTNNLNVHDYLYGLSAPDPGESQIALLNRMKRFTSRKLCQCL